MELRITGYLPEGDPISAARGGQLAQDLGITRVWTGDLAHDPFLPLALSARDTPDVGIGTAVAIAFARTPWATAALGWDLAQISNDKFILGLGTQVRSHIQRRMGGTWESPIPWLRDYISAVRAIWTHWADDSPLQYSGEFFNLNLSAPRFRPHELAVKPPPIYIAGVNKRLCRLAGEVADGFLVHGLNSAAYIKERVLPELTRDRDRETISVVVPVLIGTGADAQSAEAAKEEMRRHVAFYASTPNYRTILEVHGLESLSERLQELAAAKRWADLAAEVDDSVLDLFAVCGTPREVGQELVSRYGGLVDEVALLFPLAESEREAWTGIQEGAGSATTRPVKESTS